MKKGIRFLVNFDAVVQLIGSSRLDRFEEGLARTVGGLGTHQDPDLFQRLPLTIESEKRADLEVSGGYVKSLGDAGPFLQISEARPTGHTVIDDEKVPAF